MIEAVGPGVTDFAVGDRVATVCRPDCAYAEARIAPAARVVKLPDGIDERTAASMMVRGMTARYLLHATYTGEARRHHRDPCRGRRRRPDRQPMGQASRRDRDRHRRQRRQGRDRARPRLRPRAALRRFRRAACARSPAARACRWSTTSVGKTTFEDSLKCLAPARHPGLVRRILGRSAAGVGARARPHGLAVRHPSEPDRLHRDARRACWRPRTTCSRWWRAARSRSRSTTAIRCATPRRRTATSRRARPPARWC